MDSEISNKDQLLSSIFHQNIQLKFTCLVQDTKNLSDLLKFLISCDEKDLLSILQVIDNCCKRVSHNSKILTTVSLDVSSKSFNLYMILIDRYLNSSDIQIQSIIKDIFNSLINNSFLTKVVTDYLFQSLSTFFHEENKELNSGMMVKYFELLKIFYGENLNNPMPKNYFYFSGSSSIRVNELKLEHEKIKLKNVSIHIIKGLVLSLWFKIESFPTEVNANQCDLFQINCSKNTKIQFSLNMDKLVIKNLPQYDFIYKFPKTWTNLTLIIKPGSLFSDTEFIIIFPDTERKFKIPKLDCDCEILEMTFFHHFIGQVSTIMLFNKILPEEILKEFIKEYGTGISSEKSLLKLYSVQNKNFYDSSEFPLKKKYTKPNKHQTEIFKNVIENMRICYIPTRFNNKMIFDLTGKYNGYFNSENILNNVNNYSFFQKNIYFLGGINLMIPIIELMYVKKLMNEELLLKYLELIFIVINFRKKNIKNALDTNFFKMLSIFLEKFDPKAFTKQLLDMLLSIGKSLFSVIEDVDLASSYFEDILLNERIFIQFDLLSQIELWRNLYNFYLRDVNQIKTFLKIEKIILLLRYYDKTRLHEYCCHSHLTLFGRVENSIIMNPELPSKIDHFSNMVKLTISYNENIEDFKHLILLFSLDISPCLQKIVLDILYSYFTDKSKRIENKKKILFFLVNNNFLDILQYVYNLALVDVKSDLIKFFKELSTQQYSEIVKIKIFIDEKLIPFLKECVVPTYCLTSKGNSTKDMETDEKEKGGMNSIDNEGKKENQEGFFNKEKLSNYFEILYFNLVEWMLDKTINSSTNILSFVDDNDNIVNPYVIDVVKNLVNFSMFNKKILQNFYQDLHLLLISNKKNCFALYRNKEFYLWLIETTFRSYLQHVENDENSISNLIIIDLGKKIHSELIMNSILFDDKVSTQPMNNIHYLLSWGIFAKNRYSSSRRNLIVNNYIKKYLDDILNIFRERLKLSSNLNSSIWINFAVFTSFSFEYITFYNQEKILRLDSSSLADWGYENIILPRGIFSGLNLVQHVEANVQNSKKELAGGIWSDYEFYLSIYSIYSRFWDKQFFENHDKNIIIRYELLVSNYITNKKSKDLYIDVLKLLFNEYKPKDHLTYPVIPVKAIAVMFMITISLLQNEQEIKFWLDEYERFMIFLLLSSSNLLSNQPKYNLIQDTICDIVCFGLCFLIDEYFNTRKKASYIALYAEIIKHIFIFLSIAYKSINEYITSKKKEYKQKIINAINTLLSGQKDLTKCSLYKIFNDIVITTENKPLMSPENLNELIRSNFIDIPEIFNKESWKYSLTENVMLKERCKTLIDFFSFEVVIRERYDMMRIYKPFQEDSNSNSNLETDIQIKNLTTVVNTYLNNYKEHFKEYQNKVFTLAKVKRLLYKYLKKKLFKFRGAWCNRNLFFEQKNNLKLKTINHYTSYFAKPLLSPILDVDYYLPSFTKFQSSNLFMKNETNVNYRVQLNIDEILEKNSNQISTIKETETNLIHNLIQKIYSNFNEKNWAILQEIDKFCITSHPVYHDKHEKNSLISFECCFVKLSHHIKGKMQISKDGIYFRPFIREFIDIDKQCSEEDSELNSENKTEDDPDYDHFRKTCYGSTLTLHKKDKDVILYFWPVTDIKYIIKKRYYYKKKAFEFFTFSNKSYFFSFKNNSQRNEALKLISNSFENKRDIIIDLKDNKEDNTIAYENTLSKKLKSEKLSNIIENWANWKMSNFEFLIWLNFLSSRSYLDLSQYPVFPWIIKNYKEKEITLDNDLRDLELPMGMMEIEDKKSKERKKKYLDEYLSESNFEKLHKRHYGSHYSNPIYVSHYLVRLFPYSVISIELQGGGFDDPNRLFFSIGNSFISSASQQGDVRELVPEFFYLPETFLNLNKLNLGIRNDENKNNFLVDDVDLPSWSLNPYDFVAKLKDFLESEEVSIKINDWLDLIFGYKQKGEHAANSGNLFDYISYEDNVNIDEEENKPYFMRCAEFGLTPSQLSNAKPFPKRFLKENLLKGKQITESNNLKPFLNKSIQLGQKIKRDNNLVLKLKVLDKDVVISVLNNNSINICRFNNNEFSFNISVENKSFVCETETEKILSRKIFLDNEYYHNFPICVYSNGKVCFFLNKIIAQGGFFDGRISVYYEEKNKFSKVNYFTSFEFPVNHLIVDKAEKFAFSGNIIGNIFIFQLNNHIWNKIKVIYDHSNEITYININENLNVMATSSSDGYVNLYTLPNSRLFRSIKTEDRASIDYVFLSAFPLPVCVIYMTSKTMFSTYNINGNHISNEIETCRNLMSPLVFTDVNFRDYLIYGNNNGEVIIRRFPSMSMMRKIVVFEGRLIKSIDLSEDKKYIYLNVYNEMDVCLIKDPMDVESLTANNILINSFGF